MIRCKLKNSVICVDYIVYWPKNQFDVKQDTLKFYVNDKQKYEALIKEGTGYDIIKTATEKGYIDLVPYLNN